MQDQGQDLNVSLKPLTKPGQDIRRMFNDPNRAASKAETISPKQDLLKSQKARANVVKRVSPCTFESVEESPLSDLKAETPEQPEDDDTKAPAPPPKRKRGRPKKADSSATKITVKLKETTQNDDEQPSETSAQSGAGRPHRVCRESRPVIEHEDEEREKEEDDIGNSRISRPRRSKENNVVEETKNEENSLPMGWSRHRMVSTDKGQHHQYYIRTSHGKLLR